MSLTKEQKNGLIECLYSPMATLIAGFVKKPSNFALLERLVNEQDANKRVWVVWDLNYAIRKDTINKIKFESRVMDILDAYFEGKADGNKLPDSEPVIDKDEVEASRQNAKEQALKWLSSFKWEDLKSEDYGLARNAWFRLEHVKGMCAMHEDTIAAFKAAAEKASVEV